MESGVTYITTATVDLADDDDESAVHGDRVTAPVLTPWGAEGFVGRHYDVLDVWRQCYSPGHHDRQTVHHVPVVRHEGEP